jgi:formate hydrogenlyase subunit 6/NADH:ubiquinone oxidoreductase subunit I
MVDFLKVLFRNVLEGPSTDPFPLGETFTPQRLRGRARINPDLCMGCGICRNSCTADAINITPLDDGSGYTITIWQNSCCLCASCRHYCPTGAMSISSDWHAAHPEEEKFARLEQHTIKYEPCAGCGTLMRHVPQLLAQRLYAANPEIDPDRIRRLCAECRRQEDAKRNVGTLTGTTTETVAARELTSAAPTTY